MKIYYIYENERFHLNSHTSGGLCLQSQTFSLIFNVVARFDILRPTVYCTLFKWNTQTQQL